MRRVGSSSKRSTDGVLGAAELDEEVDALAAGQVRPERGVTGDVGEAAVHVGDVAQRIEAEDPDFASVQAQLPEDGADRRGLARAIGPEEAVDPPRGDGEVEAVERLDAAERLAEATALQHILNLTFF